jgi:hypothetical protein
VPFPSLNEMASKGRPDAFCAGIEIDPTQALAVLSKSAESLYHFTVGGPVEDTRLPTLPAYSP